MADWETIFKQKGKFFYTPHEEMEKIVELFRKEKVKRVLDLGCGSGRHTVLLAKEGFEVYGMDSSASGLDQTRIWLKEENLKVKLAKADCYQKWPFVDNFFDAIISIQVIHHAEFSKIKFCIAEMKRTLKRNGLVFITVPKTKKNKFRSKVKMIEPRTLVPLDGEEIGVPHYIFSKDLLKKSFRSFQIMDLHIDSLMHYCLLGRLRK